MSVERDALLCWPRFLCLKRVWVKSVEDQAENISAVKQAVELNPLLTEEERKVLWFVYKTAILSRRNAIREVIGSSSLAGPLEELPPRVRRMREFLEQLYSEIREIVFDAVNLIDELLFPSSAEPAQRLFYAKMTGDCFAYLSEMTRDDPNCGEYCAKAKAAYENGIVIGQAETDGTSADYLRLVRNFAVFLWERMMCRREAIELAMKVYEETMDAIGGIELEAVAILRQIKENAESWIEMLPESRIRERVRRGMEELVNARWGNKTWILERIPFEDVVGFLYTELVLGSLWNMTGQQVPVESLREEICRAAKSPVARLNRFERQLRRDPYREWYEQIVTSEDFQRQNIVERLQPGDIERLLCDVCGLKKEILDSAPTDDRALASVDGLDAVIAESIERAKMSAVTKVFRG